MKFEQKINSGETEEKKIAKDKAEERQGDLMEAFINQDYPDDDQRQRDNMEEFLKNTYGEKSAEEETKLENPEKNSSNASEKEAEPTIATNEDTEKSYIPGSGRAGRSRSVGFRGSRSEEAPAMPPRDNVIHAEDRFREQKEEPTSAANQEIVAPKADDYTETLRETSPEDRKQSPAEIGMEAALNKIDSVEDKMNQLAEKIISKSANWAKGNETLKYIISAPERIKAQYNEIKNGIQEKYNGVKEKIRGFRARFRERVRNAKRKFSDICYKIGLTMYDRMEMSDQERQARLTEKHYNKAKRRIESKLERKRTRAENAIFFQEGKNRKVEETQEKLNELIRKVEEKREILNQIREKRKQIRELAKNPSKRRETKPNASADLAEAA